MAVGPEELEGVAADGRNLLQIQIGRRGVAHQLWIRWPAHVGMAPLTFDAGTNSPQPIEGKRALMSIVPGNKKGSFLAVGRNVGWSWHSNLTQRRKGERNA
jgi:hypothetical protein